MSVTENHESIDLVGTVTMIRADKPSVGVVLDDGREVESPFRPEDEPLVLKAFAERQRLKLRITGQGRFAEDGQLEAVEQVRSVQLQNAGGSADDAVWERIEERIRSLPPEVVEKFPADGAEELDHYVYGTRRRRP